LIKSFRDALRGIRFAVLNERNMRIHLVAVAYVLFVSLFFGLSRGEYAILLLTFALVIGAEMMNTAIEILTDLGAPQYNNAAKVAKDVAAGAVLVSALFAVGVAVCLFWRADGFVRMYRYFTGAVYRIPLLLLSFAVSGLFVFMRPRSLWSELKERINRKRK